MRLVGVREEEEEEEGLLLLLLKDDISVFVGCRLVVDNVFVVYLL